MAVASRRISADESVVCAEINNEAILLNVETGIYYGLDEVGTIIWRMLSQGATYPAVIDRLLSEFNVQLGQLDVDVPAFLQLLVSKGLAQETE